VEVGGKRSQQAHRHEFRGNQREDAQRHGENAAPESVVICGASASEYVTLPNVKNLVSHEFLPLPDVVSMA
jgi:hypothetical protein